MTARSLQAVLRSLADAAPRSSDGELLRRFLEDDADAFAELVRRHGRLVWGACRHLTGSDAEADDAFQATFLVLFQNARKIRDDGRLSSWLHGVAYKVCAKSRLAGKRRVARERATAASERNGSAVPDSAWDRALAAVHEEVAKLPETLRVPFVLCCLEGKGVTEAAEQVGWKLGTFSGRLTRAKDALLAKLDARGLSLGVVVGLGVATPPATAIAKALAVTQVGFAVPSSVLQLTQGVIGMSMKSVKLLAAGLVLACGLGLGLGQSWVATADAQTGGTPPKAKAEDEIKRLQAELEAVRRAAEDANRQTLEAQKEALRQRDLVEQQRYAAAMALAAAELKGKADTASAKTSKWEYDFVLVSNMTMTKFVALLQERENRGWEYNGLTMYQHDGKLADIWVFRRPVKGLATTGYGELLNDYHRLGDKLRPGTTSHAPPAAIAPSTGDAVKADEAKVIEAQITELQAKLAELKAVKGTQLNKEKGTQARLVFPAKDLPLEAAELAEVLFKLAAKKFKNAKGSFTPTGTGLVVEGDKELLDWAAATIKKLGEK